MRSLNIFLLEKKNVCFFFYILGLRFSWAIKSLTVWWLLESEGHKKYGIQEQIYILKKLNASGDSSY